MAISSCIMLYPYHLSQFITHPYIVCKSQRPTGWFYHLRCRRKRFAKETYCCTQLLYRSKLSRYDQNWSKAFCKDTLVHGQQRVDSGLLAWCVDEGRDFRDHRNAQVRCPDVLLVSVRFCIRLRRSELMAHASCSFLSQKAVPIPLQHLAIRGWAGCHPLLHQILRLLRRSHFDTETFGSNGTDAASDSFCEKCVKENKAKEAAKEEVSFTPASPTFCTGHSPSFAHQDDWLDSLMGRCMVSSQKDACPVFGSPRNTAAVLAIFTSPTSPSQGGKSHCTGTRSVVTACTWVVRFWVMHLFSLIWVALV